jgi:hypothetical protein
MMSYGNMLVDLMCSMSVHCTIQNNNNHQLMHHNTQNLYSQGMNYPDRGQYKIPLNGG